MGEEAITREACGRAREEDVETPIPVNNGECACRRGTLRLRPEQARVRFPGTAEDLFLAFSKRSEEGWHTFTRNGFVFVKKEDEEPNVLSTHERWQRAGEGFTATARREERQKRELGRARGEAF